MKILVCHARTASDGLASAPTSICVFRSLSKGLKSIVLSYTPNSEHILEIAPCGKKNSHCMKFFICIKKITSGMHMPPSPDLFNLHVICFQYLKMLTMLMISYCFLLQVNNCKHVWISKKSRFCEKWKLQVNIAKSTGCLRKHTKVKVCSLNFEPPDIDLCSACHVYPLFREAWIISILFILNETDMGVGFHDLMNNLKPLTFKVKTFQLLLSVKSQLNVNS